MAAKKRTRNSNEPDSTYFLKILIYFVLGTIWLKADTYLVFPVGMVMGILVAQHDHFAIDRRVEYAVLLISAVIGLVGYGLYLVV